METALHTKRWVGKVEGLGVGGVSEEKKIISRSTNSREEESQLILGANSLQLAAGGGSETSVVE